MEMEFRTITECENFYQSKIEAMKKETAPKTTQQLFHPMRGHVADGCEIECDNGDVLTLNAVIRGWSLHNQHGVLVGEETNDAYLIARYVMAYDA